MRQSLLVIFLISQETENKKKEEQSETNIKKIIKTFIKNGGDINHQDKHGNTAIMHCIFQYKILKHIVDMGGDIFLKNKAGLTVKDITEKKMKTIGSTNIEDENLLQSYDFLCKKEEELKIKSIIKNKLHKIQNKKL